MADSSSAWRIGGMIDAYARHTIEASPPENIFNLELAMIGVKYTSSHVRAGVALQGGDYVRRNYRYDDLLVPPYLQMLHEAQAGIRLADELWVDVGIMPSHIGNETARSSDNFTYTRSLIAETSPYFEMGAKVSWRISKELFVAVLALNGWQNIYDYDGETAFGSLLTIGPAAEWKFGWSTYIGAAPVFQSNGIPTTRYFSDLYASYNTNDFTLAAAFDIGKQKLPIGSRDAQFETVQAVWYGATLQARWNIDSVLRLNARVETYNDPENVMKSASGRRDFEPYIPYEVVGASVGLDVLPREYTQLRFEARMLHATRDIFSVPGIDFPQQYRSTEIWFTAALVVTIP